MKLRELFEDYSQQQADKFLLKQTLEIVKDFKRNNFLDNLIKNKNSPVYYNGFITSVREPIYKYLTQRFEEYSGPVSLTDEVLSKILSPYENKTIGEMNTATTVGWLHFYRNDRKADRNGNRKLYKNIDNATSAEKFTTIIRELIEYLQSEEAESTGFYGFKVATSDIMSTADPFVFYFYEDGEPDVAEQIIHARLDARARPKHRSISGRDSKVVKYKNSDHKVEGSDSNLLAHKFAEYLFTEVEMIKQYMDKYDDNKMAEILAKTWKEKFERKDWRKM